MKDKKLDQRGIQNLVVNWLFDGNYPKIDKSFYEYEKELEKIWTFNLRKMFNTQPHILPFFNKNVNNLYLKHDTMAYLLFCKTIIQKNNFYQTQLDLNFKFIENKRQKFMKLFSKKQTEELGTIGINTLYSLNAFFNITDKHIGFKKEDDGIGLVKKEEGKEIMKNLTTLMKLKKDKKNIGLYLDILNQDVIDEKRLTVFDVKKTSNREILFIFIDKDDNKVYYKEPLNMDFYISNQTNIIYNDYIMDKNSEQFSKYNTNNYNHISKIRNAINDNFKNLINFK